MAEQPQRDVADAHGHGQDARAGGRGEGVPRRRRGMRMDRGAPARAGRADQGHRRKVRHGRCGRARQGHVRTVARAAPGRHRGGAGAGGHRRGAPCTGGDLPHTVGQVSRGEVPRADRHTMQDGA